MQICKKMNLWELAQRMGNDVSNGEALKMRELLIRYGFTGFDTSELSEETWESLLNEVIEG